MKIHTCAVALTIVSLLSGCQTLKTGDLLFHVADKENAITTVTPGMIDHVAIVISPDSVVEAVGKGVVKSSIASLLEQDGYYVKARVKGADRQKSIQRALEYLGRTYDYLYLPDNESIYCSELVQLAFVDKHGQPLFSPVPMSFHDASGQITDYWIHFYARHGMEVPEGKPGTNPGALSQRKNVKMGHRQLRKLPRR